MHVIRVLEIGLRRNCSFMHRTRLAAVVKIVDGVVFGGKAILALGLAFASDTLSVTIMEIVDNSVMLLIPGAMNAGVSEPLFWGRLALSLVIA